jgi:hypothetical protein
VLRKTEEAFVNKRRLCSELLFISPFSTERVWRTLTAPVKAIARSLMETCSCRGQLLLLRHCRPRHGRTRV